MKPADCLFVYCTAPDLKTAEDLAQRILSLKLAACANIFPEIKSLYWWKGNLQKEREIALIFKTRKSLYGRLEGEIKKIHPYECPCVAAFPFSELNAPFLKWLFDQTLSD